MITGDGEMLMGMGALATIGIQRPANLAVIVFDNGVYGETGMQPSHTQGGVDLVGVARACGIAACLDVADAAGLADLAGRLKSLDADPVRPRADRGRRAAAGAAGARRSRAEAAVPRRVGAYALSPEAPMPVLDRRETGHYNAPRFCCPAAAARSGRPGSSVGRARD